MESLKVFIFLLPLAMGFNDKILLSDLNTLNLKHGKMTNSRRSSPVPQLKCVGGTAGCREFVPQVVQCFNRGTDGFDIQWECKTDMDNAYRFGQVEVSCEGYNYPDDPYVLKGSCGLEYELDLTKEGYENKGKKSHQYYGGGSSSNHDNSYHDNDYYGYSSKKKSKSGFGDIIMLAIVCLIIYGIYKTCISTNDANNQSGYPRDQGFSQGPPPPGFRPEYMPGNDGCSSGYTRTNGFGTGMGDTGTGGGGFWTGAAAGGLLGYLFGGRNNGYNGYGTRYRTRYHNPGSSWFGNSGSTGSSWFGNSGSTGSSLFGSSGSTGYSSGSSGFSTGTRTASGFGGTKRR